MAIKTIKDESLIAIGDAIREKTGKSDLIALGDMPAEIRGIEGGTPIPEDAFKFSGNCSRLFTEGRWGWFIDAYGDKITTENVSNCEYMFSKSKAEVPFDINISNSVNSFLAMFKDYQGKELPLIKGELTPPTGNYTNNPSISNMFNSMPYVRNIPYDYFDHFGGEAFWTAAQQYNGSRGSLIAYCSSLRSGPNLNKVINIPSSSPNSLYDSLYSYCYALDEIIDLPVMKKELTSNYFSYFLQSCYRLKRFTFTTNPDGTPQVAQWKSQVIDLTQIGWTAFYSIDKILNYNSGITADKEVTDDASYQALKNDPDWFSCDIAYSRYNHDSAVETINSLPDTSAYLASKGGTNKIKFSGASGSATDGGAINTLTADEIAVATAKGWTVEIV